MIEGFHSFPQSLQKKMPWHSTSNQTTTVSFYTLSISLINAPFSATHNELKKVLLNEPQINE
jgi:hypothetical protein